MTHLCTVPNCEQRVPDSYWICADDKRVLRQDLASIPALVEDLLTTITRQDVLGTSGGRRAAETAVPWKAHASAVLWDLTNTVTMWTRVMLEHYKLSSDVIDRAQDGQQTPHQVTIAAARWLLRNLDSLTMHEAVGEAVDEIGDVLRRCYLAIDRPPDKLPAGQCLVEDCQAYLYVEAHAETVECPSCGSVHAMVERHAWMSAVMAEYRVTATEALGYVHMLLRKPMPESTWRRWLTEPIDWPGEEERSPRLRWDDVSESGHRLYRWGDVAVAMQGWMARPRKAKQEDAA